MADLPIRLADQALQAQLGRALDPEARIARAIERLGPNRVRSVRFTDLDDGIRQGQLEALGVRVLGPGPDAGAPDADVTVACWPISRRDGGRPSDALEAAAMCLEELAAEHGADAQLVIVEDYGRDEVTPLIGGADRERSLVALSRRNGPFLSRGFKLRVLHCWWQWPSLDEARAFLVAAFGDAGRAAGEAMRRPRLAYNVAIYHRGRPEALT